MKNVTNVWERIVSVQVFGQVDKAHGGFILVIK